MNATIAGYLKLFQRKKKAGMFTSNVCSFRPNQSNGAQPSTPAVLEMKHADG
jgi:hypothetical protein